jgi:DNA repair exonuclease SbcCD ATPase subunit
MLAALEDLLDSWAGTLIVVSHDRYFVERVTDQQYAIFDGRLRHLPGGVDEYLRLRAARPASTGAVAATRADGAVETGVAATDGLSGAELRTAQKELTAIERRLARLDAQIKSRRTALADHDQADYLGINKEMAAIGVLEREVEELEEQWLELSDRLP